MLRFSLLVCLALPACELADGGSDSGHAASSGAVVNDCSSAAQALRNAGVHVRNISDRVSFRCAPSSNGFRESACARRLDETTQARDEVTVAEAQVRSYCE
jgi:hypothetical protein